MATFAQFFQRQFFIDGVPLTDGKLYHYIANTSTDKHMWNERTKSTTVAQPLVSDANGVFSAYGDGLYKFILTSSAGLSDPLYTWDYVNITDADPRGEGAAIASATTLVLGPDGDFFHVTGTTTIDAINGTQVMVTLVFDGILTLTHSASLILNGGVDFLTAAGTVKQFINEGSNIWREIALTLDTVVVDIKVKKADPIIRFKNTADTAKEYAVGNDSDNYNVWVNTNTESSPTWNPLLTYANATGYWTFGASVDSPTILTPTLTVPVIASMASATHNHLNAAGGGLLGASSVGTSQVKVTAQSATSGSITDNVGGTYTFSVTGTRVGDFSIDPSTGNGGSCTLTQVHAAQTDAASTSWKLTVSGDGAGAGTTTYTINWNILGTVS